VPHGHYRDEYPPAPPREISRGRLGLPPEDFTFLFFGNIRRYKNVPLLIEAFRQVPDRNVQLVIAGAPGYAMSPQELAQLAAGDDRIHLHLAFVPDDMLPLFIGAADVVVLPFDSILNSGSVLLALSFNRTVLAPRLGALPEIQSKVGSRWLRLYDGSLTAPALEEARASQSRADEQEQVDLSAFDWSEIAQHTLDFYRSRCPEAASQSFKRSATHCEKLTIDS
jgi:glycosyltransferase involved in cell wall biosynthesis